MLWNFPLSKMHTSDRSPPISQRENAAAQLPQPVAGALVKAIVQDHEVDWYGLGHLRAVLRPERTVTHPLTGQELVMPAERVLWMAPSPALFCAANPTWTEEDARRLIPSVLPEPWEDRAVVATGNLALDDAIVDALLDTVVDAVIAGAVAHAESILVIDGVGTLRLSHREGFIGSEPGTGRPMLMRGRSWLHVDPGLALAAELSQVD